MVYIIASILTKTYGWLLDTCIMGHILERHVSYPPHGKVLRPRAENVGRQITCAAHPLALFLVVKFLVDGAGLGWVFV